jgi:energy-coupling factor transporter ATP-binding protein EcfA2
MKLKDLKTIKSQCFSNIECTIAMDSEKNVSRHETARITLDNSVLALVSKSSYCRFDILDEETKQEVMLALQKRYSVLAEIGVVSADKGLLYLYIVIFPNKVESYGDISAYVSDKDLDNLSKKWKTESNPMATLDRIRETFTITVGEHSFFAYSEYEIYEIPNEKQTKTQTIRANGLVIHGVSAVVTLKPEKNEKSVAIVCQNIKLRTPKNLPNLRLAQGAITFVNEKIEANIIIKQKLDKIKNSDYGFLAIWDKYKEEERSIEFGRSGRIGTIICDDPEFRGELRYAFRVSNDISENLREGDMLKFTGSDDADPTDRDKKRPVKIVKVGPDEIEVEGQNLVGGERFALSTAGTDAQMKNRDDARESILNGTCANPVLGLIIEGDLAQISVSENWRGERLPALSDFVRDKVFERNPPTETQVEAISIAINTPDIAIIQGPPGTGKTTVITAIIERLNEEYDKKNEVKGRILITGFQHDAVENIMSRLSVNSLPTIKFGRRNNNSDDGETINARLVENWCRETSDKIRSKNPQIKFTETQQRLYTAYKIYAEYPSDSNATALLEQMSRLPLSGEETQEVEDRLSILRENESNESEYYNDVLAAVRRLRVTLKGFKDDGLQRVSDLKEKLKNAGGDFEADIAVLESVSNENLTRERLAEHAEIKQKLLDRFTPRPVYKTPKIGVELVSLFESVMKSLGKPQNEVESVIVDFLAELENNPLGIIESLKDYNVVYAATTGQSVNKGIIEAKGKDEYDTFEYDTVIVDEAARANPLDLMVPLAKAKRRIILVGDHRQLPHLCNDDIANKITQSETDSDVHNETENVTELDYIRRSMFEHLIGRAKKLEEKDGIKRHITLDAQYRTHSLLGRFVNDSFYAPYGECFESPLPENLFAQNLPLSGGKPCVWIDVPLHKGKMSQAGESWTRKIEAETIAEQIKNLIDSGEGKNYTFGVITFYAAQRNMIVDVLSEKHGITEIQYKIGTRLKVGTVDAFQGMEFDVVFLSTVRDESGIRKRPFGRLTTENLLCVSMSRQKRLLIVVGDMKLFETDQAKKSVPALSGFVKLCRDSGTIL